MSSRRFGVSTHLFHEARLAQDHVTAIAAHGFESVEVFATRSHFDYEDPRAHQDLARWLAEAQLVLHSMHAPIVEAYAAGHGVGTLSIASADEDRRRAAVARTRSTLEVARVVAYRYLVLHLGVPNSGHVAGDNQAAAARNSLEEIADLAATVGVRVAVEVIPNALSSPDALTHMIGETLERRDIGICLDYGHAHLLGDVADAVEATSGYLLTTHVHDNGGRSDDHLVPFSGTIDWDLAIMSTQKVGYDDVMMFEVAGTGDPHEILQRTARARARLDRMFVDF